MATAKTTHYEVLSVSTAASTDEVRTAYRRLAKEHHPDRFRDPVAKKRAEEIFTAMTDAFNILTDPRRREAYDASLKTADSGESVTQKEARNYFRAGVVKLNEKNPADAIRLFKAAVHLDTTQGTYYAHLARAFEETGAYGDATRSWDEAIKRETYNARYYRSAGQCLERAGMNIRARKMYELAMQWDKSDSVAAEALRRLQDDGKKTGGLGGLFKRS